MDLKDAEVLIGGSWAHEVRGVIMHMFENSIFGQKARKRFV